MYRLLNFAWEGYCRVNNIDGYIIAPFNRENEQFAKDYLNHLLNGGSFNHLESSTGYVIPVIR